MSTVDMISRRRAGADIIAGATLRQAHTNTKWKAEKIISEDCS